MGSAPCRATWKLKSVYECPFQRATRSSMPAAISGVEGRTKQKSTCVVVPPNNIPRVSSSGPSVKRPSSGNIEMEWARCVCGSTPPGTTIFPVASMTRPPGGNVPGWATIAMRSPWTPTSHSPAPVGVTTCPPRITRSSTPSSFHRSPTKAHASDRHHHSGLCRLDDRDPRGPLDPIAVLRHPRAAHDHGVGAIGAEMSSHVDHPVERLGFVCEIDHRQLHRTLSCESPGEPHGVDHPQMARDRARQDGDHTKSLAEGESGEDAAFHNTQDRLLRCLARRVQARIAEAGDHERRRFGVEPAD